MKIKTIVALITLIPLYGFSQNDSAIQNYLKGEYASAAEGLRALAENRNGEATFDLGQMYLQGKGVAKDFTKGFQLIHQAASQNYVPAQIFLAKYYLIEKNDFNSAFSWFQKASELGNVEAQMFCASSYLYGYGVPKNIEKARKFIIKAAQNGDPLAQYELANLFMNNKSVKDQALGVLWLNKAAAQGNSKAQNLLGMMLLTGTKIPQDIPRAITLLTEAAKQQNPKSIFVLSTYFLTQPSSPDNLNQGVYWLAQNLLRDDALRQAKETQSVLLMMKPKVAKAATAPVTFIEWLKLAKEGDINAAQQVGFMYAQNRSKPENQVAATEWLTKAAVKNDYIAMIQLKALQTKWKDSAIAQGETILTPKLVPIEQAEIFDTHYRLADPNTLSTEAIIQALGRLNYDTAHAKIIIPSLKLSAKNKTKLLDNKDEIVRQANHGYAPALYQLGLMYQQGIGIKKNLQKAVKLYQLSASQNYSQAKYALGLLALNGKGMNKDVKVAEAWLTQAAFQGNAKAQRLLGQIYELGYDESDPQSSIEKNLNSAKMMYGLAATNHNSQAQYQLAQLYISGLLDPDNYQKQQQYYQRAYKLFKQASLKFPQAKLALAYFYLNSNQPQKNQQWAFEVAQDFSSKGNEQATLLLALMYDRGIGTEKNTAKALDLWKEMAEAGNSIALYVLGSKYGLGEDVTKSQILARNYLTRASSADIGFANYNLAVLNYQEADTAGFLELLKLAKEQNYSPAGILLADYYLTHEGEPDEMKQAISTYQNLAMGGNVQAQIKLAYMNQNGIYFATNYPQALAWYQKAAEQNNALAQYALAEMYQVGQGTDRDLTLAISWYEKAAKQQFAPAQIALGFINEVDLQNYVQARIWYERASKNGKNPIADYNLGLLYEYGKGVPVDTTIAKLLYEQASSNGFESATTALNEITQQGTKAVN